VHARKLISATAGTSGQHQTALQALVGAALAFLCAKNLIDVRAYGPQQV
jgi:hypothetical protein